MTGESPARSLHARPEAVQHDDHRVTSDWGHTRRGGTTRYRRCSPAKLTRFHRHCAFFLRWFSGLTTLLPPLALSLSKGPLLSPFPRERGKVRMGGYPMYTPPPHVERLPRRIPRVVRGQEGRTPRPLPPACRAAPIGMPCRRERSSGTTRGAPSPARVRLLVVTAPCRWTPGCDDVSRAPPAARNRRRCRGNQSDQPRLRRRHYHAVLPHAKTPPARETAMMLPQPAWTMGRQHGPRQVERRVQIDAHHRPPLRVGRTRSAACAGGWPRCSPARPPAPASTPPRSPSGPTASGSRHVGEHGIARGRPGPSMSCAVSLIALRGFRRPFHDGRSRPSDASASAIARPMFRPAPVTSANPALQLHSAPSNVPPHRARPLSPPRPPCPQPAPPARALPFALREIEG